MSLQELNAERIAAEWTERIGSRLAQAGVAEDEVSENVTIIRSFTKTAVDLLKEEPQVILPHDDIPLRFDAEMAHQVIGLFIRGVNQMAKRLRATGLSWEERQAIIEKASWETFNMAKIMVGLLYKPSPQTEGVLTGERQLQLLMKHSCDDVLKKYLPNNATPMSYHSNIRHFPQKR